MAVEFQCCMETVEACPSPSITTWLHNYASPPGCLCESYGVTCPMTWRSYWHICDNLF